jgi:hypothetical protein
MNRRVALLVAVGVLPGAGVSLWRAGFGVNSLDPAIITVGEIACKPVDN